jgi:hypothetical protein
MRDSLVVFVREENIRSYIKQLEGEVRPEARAMLLRLLAEEREKGLRAYSGSFRAA